MRMEEFLKKCRITAGVVKEETLIKGAKKYVPAESYYKVTKTVEVKEGKKTKKDTKGVFFRAGR